MGACSGEVLGPAAPPPGSLRDAPIAQTSAFVCKENGGLTPAKLRRLSRAQYANSLRDFVATALPGEDAWADIQAQIDALPKDVVNKAAPFSTMDQAVSQQHVDTYMHVGEFVARTLTATPQRVAKLAPCAAGTDASDCVDGLIERLAQRAYRRPASDAERAFLREVYDADAIDAEAIRALLTVLLNGPQFLYLVEFGSEPVAGRAGVYELDDYELASRLSYHFWQTAPDQKLLDAAEDGELSSTDGYGRVVDWMLADPRAAESLETFVREWFDLEELRQLDALKADPVFAAFAGDDMPSPELREDMIDDVLESFTFHLDQGDGLREWLESPYSFARSEGLAAIYKTPTWSGRDEPPRFPNGERAGLLTRAALLATGTANTRPIMKGVFIRQRLLCDVVPPPPPNVANVPPPLSEGQTTREVVQALTEAPKTNCVGCHTSLINPLGFATENFDALGRLRTHQRMFDENGRQVATKPIDTKSVPRVAAGDTRPSSGVHDLLDYIVESGKVEACFARQYVRFAYGRDESAETDGCALSQLRDKLAKGESLSYAVRELALRPEFRRRYVAD